MKERIKYMVLFTWILLGSGSIQSMHAQYFTNPSFEGPPGIGMAPPSWSPADPDATPDTEPLQCDTYGASEGLTYMTLVTRADTHAIPLSVENASTLLLEPLTAGNFYRLEADLASRKDVGYFDWDLGFVAYTSPVLLRIYESTNGSDQGILLAESETITHHEWNTHAFILHSVRDIDFLMLEVGFGTDSSGHRASGHGNLLIDNLRIEVLDEPPIDYGELQVPNLFTPNGDGLNDEFVIRGLKQNSTLTVFDRLGREVFHSPRYMQDWDGTDKHGNALPQDSYLYVLYPSNMDEAVKGYVYLKRER